MCCFSSTCTSANRESTKAQLYFNSSDRLLGLFHNHRRDLGNLCGDSLEKKIMKLEGHPIVFAYNVLKAATNNFRIGCKLDEGGTGAICKGVLQDGSEVAVKQVSTTSWQGNEEFLYTVALITGVHPPNLVKLCGCCIEGIKWLLVFEYLEHSSVHQALFFVGFANQGKDVGGHSKWFGVLARESPICDIKCSMIRHRPKPKDCRLWNSTPGFEDKSNVKHRLCRNTVRRVR